jgi:hypothetical protein
MANCRQQEKVDGDYKEQLDPDLNCDDVTVIQRKVDELHDLYDAAVVNKHRLKNRLDMMRKQLKMAKQLIARYSSFEWDFVRIWI